MWIINLNLSIIFDIFSTFQPQESTFHMRRYKNNILFSFTWLAFWLAVSPGYFLNCPDTIEGIVKNEKTHEPIANVSIEYFDQEGNSDTVFTDEQGHFTISGVDCTKRYDIVAYHENYNGFSELQIIPQKNNFVNLYLNPELPPEFSEEIYTENVISVIDPETNTVVESVEVIKPEEANQQELSFYQRKELARQEKERLKKERILAEQKAEEERKLAEQRRIAEAKKAMEERRKMLQAERERILAEAKQKAEELKKQQELAKQEQTAKAEKARQEREQEIARAKQQAEQDDDVYRQPGDKDIQDKRAQLEQEREQRIAEAKARAEALRKQQELAKQEQTAGDTGKEEKVSGPDYSNPNRCAYHIRGIITNGLINKPVEGANIDVYFEGENIESTKSGKDGTFEFINMECDTKYTLICYKAEIDDLVKFTINTGEYEGLVELKLTPEVKPEPEPEPEPAVAETTTGNETEEEEPMSLSEYRKKHKGEKIDIVKEEKETGDEDGPLRLSEYQKKQKELEENIVDFQSFIRAYPEYSKVETPKISGNKVELKNIYFELDEYYLTKEARKELDKIVVLMIKNPEMIIEAGSHTDSRGPFDYNMVLSEKRSQEVVGYLIANGVDPDRITGRGYGETMPLNRCVDGVKCTEEEYLVNRRTEFRILHQ